MIKVTIDLKQFIDWYNEDPEGRMISFEAGKNDTRLTNLVYCYDRKKNIGKYVATIAEFDPVVAKREKDLKDLERLLNEYPDYANQSPAATGRVTVKFYHGGE